jgi:CheY-like chemotaxis protein
LDRFEPRKLILVVDGYEDVREAVCALLRAHGYLVASAATGVKALAVLRLFKSVGLILIDWNLPGGRSGEVLAEIRKLPEFAQVPVIALTTDDQRQPAGVQGYVRKPYLQPLVLEVARTYCGIPSSWDGEVGGAMA